MIRLFAVYVGSVGEFAKRAIPKLDLFAKFPRIGLRADLEACCREARPMFEDEKIQALIKEADEVLANKAPFSWETVYKQRKCLATLREHLAASEPVDLPQAS